MIARLKKQLNLFFYFFYDFDINTSLIEVANFSNLEKIKLF